MKDLKLGKPRKAPKELDLIRNRADQYFNNKFKNMVRFSGGQWLEFSNGKSFCFSYINVFDQNLGITYRIIVAKNLGLDKLYLYGLARFRFGKKNFYDLWSPEGAPKHINNFALHRVMSEGVNNHDRVLLICSKNSVNRYGVLNEIERMLEREAKEGGTEIIIPIALDDYIFNDWNPEQKDIKDQIISRVISSINEVNFNKEIEKIVEALTK